MIPARAVHGGAAVLLDAGDVGWLWLAEHAGRAYHKARGDALAARGLEAPHVGVLVEDRADDLGVQPDAIAHVVLIDAVLCVGLELVAGRVHARPVAALLEGELVAEGGDINGDAGIGVPVPGATDAVALLEHDEIREASLIKLDRGPDPREACSDHDDLVIHCDIRSIHIFRISDRRSRRPTGGIGRTPHAEHPAVDWVREMYRHRGRSAATRM